MSTDYNPTDIWEALPNETQEDISVGVVADNPDEFLAVLKTGDANRLKSWMWEKIEQKIIYEQEFRSRWNLDAICQPEPLKETLEDIARTPTLLRRQAG